ncbi:dTMP kinase [Piscirickettsia litoralis]|uniref:Thymidylate kinase n=1 Tax=Piscirickettsia litoralis TaxID=1891921 RepID=A0ABX3A3Y3_9GAMM|nr:dTMP kinase [Piscirickettsia litoralis]ODN43543.1 dTMP kinase [Piscirickettsia litoralis]
MSGQFVVVEGLEGAGKSTVLSVIEEYLIKKICSVMKTREPGGTALAEEIRSLLLKHDANEVIVPEAELLLMYASRVQHIELKIKPALQQGQWVLCDRFALSSFAYQGGGRNLSMSTLQQVHDAVVQGFSPNLTFYLDIDPLLGLERAKRRGELDRIEQEKVDFFIRAREVYLEHAHSDPTVILINAEQSMEKVANDVCQQLDKVIL